MLFSCFGGREEKPGVLIWPFEGLEPSDTRRKRKSPMDVDADEVWGLLILQRRKR